MIFVINVIVKISTFPHISLFSVGTKVNGREIDQNKKGRAW